LAALATLLARPVALLLLVLLTALPLPALLFRALATLTLLATLLLLATLMLLMDTLLLSALFTHGSLHLGGCSRGSYRGFDDAAQIDVGVTAREVS